MKHVLILCCLFYLSSSLAQVSSDSSWTWISGNRRLPQYAEYGTAGVAATDNLFGARKGALCWKDHTGGIWAMGGEGYGFDCYGWMSDLWKYNTVTNEWTWVSGSKQRLSPPIYGTKGVAAAGNYPGTRMHSVHWADNNGNLWLMGGLTFDAVFTYHSVRNDLWKYNIASGLWTWMQGDTINNNQGYYGSRGIAGNLNSPGSRMGSAAWTDANGKLWMYGGASFWSSDGASVPWSDLWKYDPAINQWTWMKGDTIAGITGVWGSAGVSSAGNNPGQRIFPMTWKDQQGRFWLFGGRSSGDNGPVLYDDLWRYDQASGNWTWMKGSNTTNRNAFFGPQGVFNSNYNPGSRHSAAAWVDTSGNFWLFGGQGNSYTYGYNSDLWKYNLSTNQWAWMGGSQYAQLLGVYGQQGTSSAAYKPGARSKSIYFSDTNGNLYLQGGEVWTNSGERLYNDLWKYNTATGLWSWIKGDSRPVLGGYYNNKTVASNKNKIPAKGGAVSWKDNNGDLWIFGGFGNDGGGVNVGEMNDLWKYVIGSKQWVWMKGDSLISQNGRYGTRGIPSATNNPGSRSGAVSWKDNNGNLWLFGGSGYDINGSTNYLNDLWKYDVSTGNWTWLKGDSVGNKLGLYGTKGVAAASNKPGARQKSCAWTDAHGDFWLFSGEGYGEFTFPNGGLGLCNDLWKYSVADNQWTWINGSSAVNARGNYGFIGVDSSINSPGARFYSTCWTDNNGNYWMYGGYGYAASYSGHLSDVWKYNPVKNVWTFMQGSEQINVPAVYGIKNIAAPANTPGAIRSGIPFTDAVGNCWLFGGLNTNFERNNTLWKFDLLTLEWTWVKGDTLAGKYGIYGKKGASNILNEPGARENAASWVDNDFNFWMYGGYGTSTNSNGYAICKEPSNFYQPVILSNLDDLWGIGKYIADTLDFKTCLLANGSISSDITGISYQWRRNTGAGFTAFTDNAVVSGSSTAALQFSNIPLAWNGYQFQCIIDGNKVSTVYTLKIENSWTGAVSKAWEDPANWACNVLPDSTTDVVINAGLVNYPFVSSNPVIGSIVVKPGASVFVRAGYDLKLTKQR